VPNPDLTAWKKHLRRHLRVVRVENSLAASIRIVERLSPLISSHPEWRCIALFAALPSEPNLQELHARFPDRLFAYPRVISDEMVFHAVHQPDQELITARWGLREPIDTLPLVPAQEIDLMLCPGMAFTNDGKRLGKGGGFYDRYLSHLSTHRPYRIGVTFAAYLIDDMPQEPHDSTMHAVVCDA
jgi:5-formyltetrahydrofolate cyclo-ligase